MTADRRRPPPRRVDRGIALIPALFLIVVLASLAAFGVRIYTASQQTVVLALQGARALAAARAGIDWGAARAFAGSCVDDELGLTEGALDGFLVRISCTQNDHEEAGTTVRVYDIEAVAMQGEYGGADYVSRRVRASFADTL
jgi:MSHA biogenesis protein MshP